MEAARRAGMNPAKTAATARVAIATKRIAGLTPLIS